MHQHALRPGAVLRRLALFMIPAWLLLPLAFLIPALNAPGMQEVDLTGSLGIVAYSVAASGGRWGVPVLAGLLLAVLLSRAGLSHRQRRREALVITLGLGVVLGGGVYLNEYGLKPVLGVARPNIEHLAHGAAGTLPEHTPLGRTAADFYALGDKQTRSDSLRARSTAAGFGGVALHPLVRDHWIVETGFSFPSGHAFGAMLFAAFFLALGLRVLTGWRLWLFYLVVPWAVLVCYSRPLLRVHSPLDITVGGLEGLVVGVVAFLLVGRALDRVKDREHLDLIQAP